jgi:phage replication O-like protein O
MLAGGVKMANPQAENGHVDIANELVEYLARYRLSGEEWQTLLVIWRKTYGWHKKEDKISLSQFAVMTGLKKQTAHRALKKLSSKKIIAIIKNDDSQINSFRFNKDFDKWLPSSKKITPSSNLITGVIKNDYEPSSKMITTKEKKETITKEKRDLSDFLKTSFETFYQLYPLHQGRKKAFDVWMKLNFQNGTRETIIQAIEKQKVYKDHLKKLGQFCPEWPMPATWLSQRRWEDEVEIPTVNSENNFL